MPFDIKSTLETLENWFVKSGYLQKVQIGEPKQPPQERLSAALFMKSVNTILVFTNGGTREVHSVTMRVHMDMLAEPEQDIELGLAKVVSSISSDLLGDADLGATIVNVDAAGAHGTPYGATWGYLDIGGKKYRVVDILIPLIVDDSATAVP